MISRVQQFVLQKRLKSPKVIQLVGAEGVGKRTLIHEVAETLDRELIEVEASPNSQIPDAMLQGATDDAIIFIHHAHHDPNLDVWVSGKSEQYPGHRYVLSTTCAPELNGCEWKALEGRKWIFPLFPVSWKEWEQEEGYIRADQSLNDRLIYGMYPEVVHASNPGEKLNQLIDNRMLADSSNILSIRKKEVLMDLLRLLALNLGNETFYAPLADQLGIDAKTVASYISVLEQSYLIIRLPSFSEKLNNEMKASRKFYFFDTGIRNALIQDFRSLTLRNDKDILWENFLISERVKVNYYRRKLIPMMYWKTKQNQEIRYLERAENRLQAYAFAWSSKRNPRFSKTFTNNYESDLQAVDREAFRDFLSD
ncbi:MAG: DUF4143 domain-containing protein [Bacteroidota bacterium]